MNALTHNRWLDLILFILLLATGATWWLGEQGANGRTAMLLMLGIAGLKGTLIVLEFMALRCVKVMWSLLLLGWLLVVLAFITLAYLRNSP